MQRYTIERKEIVLRTYCVTADSPAEALARWLNGQGDMSDDETLDVERAEVFDEDHQNVTPAEGE